MGYMVPKQQARHPDTGGIVGISPDPVLLDTTHEGIKNKIMYLNNFDEYINELKRFEYWMDCAVIIKGNAVKSFLAMFF